MKSRAVRMLVLLSLVVTPLGVAVSSGPAQAVTPDQYVPRWCGPSVPTPCLVSASRNGTPFTASDPNYEIDSTAALSTADFKYFGFLVQGKTISTTLATSDTWQFYFDTGTLDPNYMEGFAGVPDMDRIADGDGTYHVRYTAKPIVYTTGCNESAAWPWPCSTTAASDEVKLSVEVQDRSDEFVGFYSAQSPQGVNGIFLETAADGSRYLSSEMVNSHYLHDGVTVFKGQVRFRIPYKMLHDSFGVPDPSTMVASSLSGTVNGGTTGATFSVYHDPDGGGMFVDITDLTFSKKVIKVRRGVIVPTRPTNLHAKRRDAHSGRVSFTLSTPRGARPTGYQIRCVSGSGQVVKNTKTTPTSPIRIGGLRRGVGYACKVRATSKAGPGAWSLVVRMPRHS